MPAFAEQLLYIFKYSAATGNSEARYSSLNWLFCRRSSTQASEKSITFEQAILTYVGLCRTIVVYIQMFGSNRQSQWGIFVAKATVLWEKQYPGEREGYNFWDSNFDICRILPNNYYICLSIRQQPATPASDIRCSNWLLGEALPKREEH